MYLGWYSRLIRKQETPYWKELVWGFLLLFKEEERRREKRGGRRKREEREREEREEHHYFVENLKNPVTTRLPEHLFFSH
nr:MAG TPA: hypothetical protein [Caudoviricetes sp.]